MSTSCRCRYTKCAKYYDPMKTKASYRGYCSIKCQTAMAKALGWGPEVGTMYAVLQRHGQIGDVLIGQEGEDHREAN